MMAGAASRPRTPAVRTLHVVTSAQAGGTVRSAIDLCRTEHEAGRAAELWSLVPTQRAAVRAIAARAGIAFRELDRARLVPALLARTVRERPDLVLVHSGRGTVSGSATGLARLLGATGIPCVSFVHGSLALDEGDAAGLERHRHRAQRVRALVVTTPAERDRHAAAGIDPDRIVPVPNVITAPAGRGGDPASVRREHALGDGPLVATVCRLSPQKGLAELVEAAGRLRAAGRDVTLAIAGEGPMRPTLESAVRAADGRVRLLGHVEGVADLLRSADACAFPSHAESFGRAALEAMLLGRPTVLSDIRPWTDWFEDGRDARIAALGDAGAIARALTALLDDPAAATALGARGRIAAEACCGPTAALAGLDALRARLDRGAAPARPSASAVAAATTPTGEECARCP